jgi:hypothetical protein
VIASWAFLIARAWEKGEGRREKGDGQPDQMGSVWKIEGEINVKGAENNHQPNYLLHL